MKIKHQNIEVDPDDPFKNCKLERKPYAEVLTNLVQNYSNGFVLAINNEWGTGKTTFVKMWQRHLELQQFKTLYFNAWENDYEKEALVAIMSELKSLTDTQTLKTFNTVVEKATPIVKKLVPAILKTFAEKYVGNDFLQELLKSGIDGSADLFDKEMDHYIEKKKSIETFKQSLSEFIIQTTSDKPLVFIIDELDRCRPSYAVEVLEQIKHLFSVPNIVFVLSIDKEQLGHAVRGVYGSENINAEKYLQRFIDVEYTIPEPDSQKFVHYLFEYFEFRRFFDGRRNGQEEYELFNSFITALIKIKNLPLRVQEKLFSHINLTFSTIGPNYTAPSVLVFLVYLKTLDNGFYKSLKNKELSYQEIVDKVENKLSTKNIPDVNHRFLVMLAQLLVVYKNSFKKINDNAKLFLNDDKSGSYKCVVSSSITTNHYNIEQMITHTEERSECAYINIEYLTSKIDLLERFYN